MLELTRKSDYAIRGMLYLAHQAEGRISLISEIAAGALVPQSFLGKILQNFSKIGLVRSTRGTGGGFTLGRPADTITLLDIVEAVEGSIKPNFCVLQDNMCGLQKACKVHPVWMRLRDEIRQTLGGVTLKELA